MIITAQKDIARIRKTMQLVTKTCYNLSLRTLLVLRNMKINRSVISNLLWTKADGYIACLLTIQLNMCIQQSLSDYY